MRILYNSWLSQYKAPFGTLKPGEPCTMQLKIPCSCQTCAAELVLLREDGGEYRRLPFSRRCADELYETWGGTFCLPEPMLVFYYFHITTRNEAFRLYKQGSETNMEAGDLWQLSAVSQALLPPEAAMGAVMYQVFPDRFAISGSCDLTGKLQPYWVHENLDDTPVFRPDEKGEVLNNDFYGGNLRGVQEKLPYLASLGVEYLYLNPIFMAWSTHRYDTCDYRRIDPMLGTDGDFRALCEGAHALGMKVILDGVFSHVGSRSLYFQSAVQDPASPYRSWFQFQHYPDVYTSWWGVTTLPCIDKRSLDFRRFLIDGEDSVCVHWLRLGADGWRLDVADELPDEWILRLKKRIRAEKPDALLIGEVWEDASNKIAYDVRRRYFVDGELDSVMNYPWRKAILRYVRGEDDGSGLAQSIMTLAENYPPQVLSCVMNILSTHDTPRAINELLDPRDGEREELARRSFSSEALARGKQLLRMAVFLQFTLPGMACIYYADEAGLTGYRDPFNRRFYPWGREDEALARFYRDLGQLKKSSPALRCGGVEVLTGGGGRLLFRRSCKEGSMNVYCNRGAEPWLVQQRGTLRFGGNLERYTPGGVILAPGGYCLMEI